MLDSDSDDYVERFSPSRRRTSSGSPYRYSPHPPKSPVEKFQQNGIEKIAELFEGTQEEFKKTGEEIRLIEARQKAEHERVT